MEEDPSNDPAWLGKRMRRRRVALWIALAVLLTLSAAEILYLTFFMRQWP
jgi:hypothetical protein